MTVHLPRHRSHFLAGRQLPACSTDITNLRDASRAFLAAGSPRVMLTAAGSASLARALLGTFGWHDLAAMTAVIGATGTVEWVIHKYLLHAPEDSWRTRRLDSSTSHRQHHEDPTDMRHVMLRATHAARFLVAIAAFTAGWSIPMARLATWPVGPTFLTGLAASWWTLTHYEWVHLTVHTRHRFRNRFYARLARNHRLHHYRNENYWLGVTSNSGDRLLGTLPKHKSDVPLSETARSLH
jgi:hypothetical protein